MKTFPSILLACLACRALASDPFEAGGFYAVRTADFNAYRSGAGAFVRYDLARSLAVEAEGASFETRHAAIDQAGLNLRWRPAVKSRSLQPVLFAGGGHDFESRRAFVNAGGGLEIKTLWRFHLFGDARWQRTLPTGDACLIRAGLGIKF